MELKNFESIFFFVGYVFFYFIERGGIRGGYLESLMGFLWVIFKEDIVYIIVLEVVEVEEVLCRLECVIGLRELKWGFFNVV